jgi:hypothetical protein
VSSQLCSLVKKIPSVSILYQAGWATELVWMWWWRETSPASIGNWMLDVQIIVSHFTGWDNSRHYADETNSELGFHLAGSHRILNTIKLKDHPVSKHHAMKADGGCMGRRHICDMVLNILIPMHPTGNQTPAIHSDPSLD